MNTEKTKEEQFTEVFYSHVKIETSPRSISNLFLSERKRKKIDYKPYYQRNYVWDDNKATYFIESILLGTEIPPLIFFNEGSRIEVIDGRQRFETIKRFLNNQFCLTKSGLTALTDMKGKYIDDFRSTYPQIYELFIDAKIRIIEFNLVNNPPDNPILVDRIKKEIFSRYNSGITPLKRAEIDNAVYDSDQLSNYFKGQLKSDPDELRMMSNLFLRKFKSKKNADIESILSFIRKSLVIYKFPIKHYARGKIRTEVVKKFYEFSYSNLDNDGVLSIYDNFIGKVKLIEDVRSRLEDDKHKEARLFWECLLWCMNILDQEEINYKELIENIDIDDFSSFLYENEEHFDGINSHHYKKILDRYGMMISFIKKYLSDDNLCIYTEGDVNSISKIKEVLLYNNDSKTELEKLSSLRITKPDPARSCIEDILSDMKRSRFLVRPSYQRSEVINLGKSSSIIESILLGIMLPAIFVYKQKSGTIEVIDGQQRLLTILAFMGEKYLDENNNYQFSKNNNFSLKGLRVLKHLNGCKFGDMPEELQEKIWDFELFIVEIGEQLNPEFNPIDLFIRLNDKPYPIKENSFEMWNSWADKEIVDEIKSILANCKSWFYIKNSSKEKFLDRMENEELISILSYYDYKLRINEDVNKFIAIYQVENRINARVKEKKNVTATLFDVTEDLEKKSEFINSIKNIKVFLFKLKSLLNNFNESVSLEESLHSLVSYGSQRRYVRRTLQELYILWYAIENLSDESLNNPQVYSDLKNIFYSMKNVTDENDQMKGGKFFVSEVDAFRKKYK